MQLKSGIRIKRRGAENAELRRAEAAEVPQMLSSDWSAKLCVSPRSQRLCVMVSPASTAWSLLRLLPGHKILDQPPVQLRQSGFAGRTNRKHNYAQRNPDCCDGVDGRAVPDR